MPTLGPYLKSTSSTHWCYFDIQPGVIKYYEAPYTEQVTALSWQETVLAADTYVYDPQTRRALGYFMRSDNLYQIPLEILVGTRFVNQVLQINLVNNEIKTPLASKRAREFNVNLDLYPKPQNLVVANIPALISEQLVIEQSIDLDAVLSIDSLKVAKCSIISDATKIPAVLSDGEMSVWKTTNAWLFAVEFLGQIKSGQFDQTLDHRVIQVLNEQSAAGVGEIDLSRFDFMPCALNRPYLVLSHHQQSTIFATFRYSVPLDEELSREENIQVGRAVVLGTRLSDAEVSDPEKCTNLNNTIHNFRVFLYPSYVNESFGRENFYPALSSEPGYDTTIADIILFVKYLLMASLRKLGDREELAINQPPVSSRVKCGELVGVNSRDTLVYQGLSEQYNDFIELFMNYYTSGVTRLDIDQLMNFKNILEKLIARANYPEILDLETELAAIYAAQHDLSNVEAVDQLCALHQQILVNVNQHITRCFSWFLDSPQEIKDFLKHYDLITVFKSQWPYIQHAFEKTIKWLRRLETKGLLTLTSAKQDYAALIKIIVNDPNHVADEILYILLNNGCWPIVRAQVAHQVYGPNLYEFLVSLKRHDMLTEEFLIAPYQVVEGVIFIREHAILRDNLILSNFTAIFESFDWISFLKSLVRACTLLQQEGLITPDISKMIGNGDYLMIHYRNDPHNAFTFEERLTAITSAIISLKSQDLLTLQNLEFVFLSPRPKYMADAIRLIKAHDFLSYDLLSTIPKNILPNLYIQAVIFAEQNTSLKNNQLISNNMRKILNSWESEDVLQACLILINNHLLVTEDFINTVLDFFNRVTYPGYYLLDTLKILTSEKILNSGLTFELFDSFIKLSYKIDYDDLIRIIPQLFKVNLLSVENLQLIQDREVIEVWAGTYSISSELKYLLRKGDHTWNLLFTGESAQEIYASIVTSRNGVWHIAEILDELIILHNANLLTGSLVAEYHHIFKGANPKGKAEVIIQLQQLNLFTAEIAKELHVTTEPLKVLEAAKYKRELQVWSSLFAHEPEIEGDFSTTSTCLMM